LIKTEKGIQRNKLLSYMPNLIALLIIFIFSAHYFTQKGIAEAALTLRLLTAMSPIIIPVAVFSLIRTRYRSVISRREDWIYDGLVIIVFTVVIIWGLLLPNREASKDYTDLFNVIVTQGTTATSALMAFSMAATFMRSFIARNKQMFLVVFITITAMFTVSPIADTIFRPWADFGRIIQNYVQASVDTLVWMGVWTGLLVTTVNVALNREKLRPG